MKKAVKAVCFTLKIALALVAVFELAVIALGLIGGDEAVAKLPVYAWEITSDSMYPKLKDGDRIICASIPFSMLNKGDIITYANNGDWITHRIESENDDGTVTTKGIANSYADGKISANEYVGKMLFKLPFSDSFADLTQTVSGKIIFIAIVVVVCFGSPVFIGVADKIKSKKSLKNN